MIHVASPTSNCSPQNGCDSGLASYSYLDLVEAVVGDVHSTMQVLFIKMDGIQQQFLGISSSS